MFNSVEGFVYLGLVGILALWFLLPLVPAVLLYKLFPATTISAQGVLANFKINATGAFAGYLVLFATMLPFVRPTTDYVGNLVHACWTISGQVRIVDANNTDMHYPSLFQAIRVRTMPAMNSFGDPQFLITVPAHEKGLLPDIALEIQETPGFLPGVLDAEKASDRDTFYKTIKIVGPVIIKRSGVNLSTDARAQ
jgi:hypothetical protein